MSQTESDFLGILSRKNSRAVAYAVSQLLARGGNERYAHARNNLSGGIPNRTEILVGKSFEPLYRSYKARERIFNCPSVNPEVLAYCTPLVVRALLLTFKSEFHWLAQAGSSEIG